MSSVSETGFKSSSLFEALSLSLANADARREAGKTVNGVFHLVLKNAAGVEATWTLDLKAAASSPSQAAPVAKGANGKPDIVVSLADDTFVDLAAGKINGQKAFMAGKLKVKGNIALATKLDAVLKNAKPSAPAAAAPKPAAAVAPSAPSSATVAVAGFESSVIFAEIEAGLKSSTKDQLDAAVKKVKAVFQFDVKNAASVVQTWTLDLKSVASVVKGAGAKADVTVAVGDKDFVDLANGKLNGQKAFMSGKIKVKGQIMLATKLDAVLKDLRPKASKL
ncbi:UNVERIFIED_CONTAM: hypothetical protein HDU68_011315 [Siphonaria sp. JEL0065]|nr:hypothetical protein HDU68_011315 [Siphonaria sp. JEL0065]